MLALAPTLTRQQAVGCLDDLLAAIATAPENELQIDASKLQIFDSAALATLLACRRAALAAGKNVTIHGWPQRLLGLARVYGVAQWLGA